MATTRHISQRIKSIKNIQHITKAMKMVAAARLKRAQLRLESARPYAQKMAAVTLDLAMLHAGEGSALLKPKPQAQKPLIVLFTGDRGLCGGFHERVIEQGLALAKELGNAVTPAFFVIGRQGVRIMRRQRVPIEQIYDQPTRGVSYMAAKALAHKLIGLYQQGTYSRIYLVFSRFQSALAQKPRVFQLLPVEVSLAARPAPKGYFIFEPSADDLLEALLANYMASEVFRAFLECETGELGARMTAMANATDSAGEMISRLVLDFNRARQALITREISEIMSGAEAQKRE